MEFDNGCIWNIISCISMILLTSSTLLGKKTRTIYSYYILVLYTRTIYCVYTHMDLWTHRWICHYPMMGPHSLRAALIPAKMASRQLCDC